MTSERILKRIESLLDQADQAVDARDWVEVREISKTVLRLDPENEDAVAYLKAAEGGATAGDGPTEKDDATAETTSLSDHPVIGVDLRWAQLDNVMLHFSPHSAHYLRFAERRGDRVDGPPAPAPYAQVEVKLVPDGWGREALHGLWIGGGEWAPSTGVALEEARRLVDEWPTMWLPLVHREDFKVIDWLRERFLAAEETEIFILYKHKRGMLGRFKAALTVTVFRRGFPTIVSFARVLAADWGLADADLVSHQDSRDAGVIWHHKRGPFKVPDGG